VIEMTEIATPTFDFLPGTTPLLISMPHPGVLLPPEIQGNLAPEARSLPDTDWHVPRLYHFAPAMGAGILAARYSRFAIDLNRPPDDAPLYKGATTGLYPATLFDGSPLFQDGISPSEEIRRSCLDEIWRPYHRCVELELARIRERHGHAVLLDAHSIKGVVPRLFEGELPDFNLGSNDGASCAHSLEALAFGACRHPGYRSVLNGRFKGGYITRHYGQPQTGVHALQLELAQRTYMIEAPPFAFDEVLAAGVHPVLISLIRLLIEWRP
jgi:formiminoglutamase